MGRIAAVFRVLLTFVFMVSVFTPFATVQALAQTTDTEETASTAAEAPPTGTLQIWLTASDTGGALGGACFTVTDANGAAQSACDNDFDGLTTLYELPAGYYSAAQSSPANGGYIADAWGDATVTAGGLAEIRLSNAPVPVVQQQEPAPVDTDADDDGYADDVDNCAFVWNDQADADADGIGDACDDFTDTDADGVADGADNCAVVPNADQTDADGDGVGAACDDNDTPVVEPTDTDEDGVTDDVDNCVNDANADQLDTDGDGAGDACDDNDDDDRVPDAEDNCPVKPNNGQSDKDGDGIGTACDDEEVEAEARTSDIVIAAVNGPDGGDITVNFTAVAPNGSEVNSLQPFKDLKCGTPITFYDTITVKNGTATGSSTIQLVHIFGQETTSGGQVGFLPGDISASIVSGGNNNSTLSTSVVAGTGSGGADVSIVTLTLTGVDYGETLKIAITATPTCRNTSAVGGTIQADFQGGTVTAGGTGEVKGGGQTIPLSAQNIIQPFIDVTKACPTTTTGPAGTVLQFPITITNTGNVALALTVTESLSGTFSPALPASLAANGGSYTGVFRYTTTGSETNANNTITVTGAYAEGTASGSVSDTASVTCPFTVTAPNVTIAKTADAATVPAGSPIGFSITIRNQGTAATPGTVTFTDQLPAGSGVTWTESPDTACTISSAGLLSCTVGPLAANNNAPGGPDEFSVHVTSPTTVASCGVFPNTATLSSPYSGSASASITVTCADVGVEKVATTPTVGAGGTATFTITVSTTGTGASQDVNLTDSLPDGFSIVSATQDGGTDVLAACSSLTGAASCDFGDLPSGTTIEVVVQGTTTVDQCAAGIANTANVSAAFDTDSANNSDSATITVACPDVVILKSVSAGTVTAGDPVTFTITAENLSTTAQANNVVISDNLPDGVNWSTTTAGCSITPDGTADQVLTCTVGTLGIQDFAGGGANEFTVTVTGTTSNAACTTLVNRATVTADGDIEPGNNISETVTVTVNCPDITVVKTPNDQTIGAGQTATFTIVVTNNGPGTATDVTLVDTLPAGTWNVSTTAGTCPATATGTLNCSFGSLVDDASVTVSVSRVTTSADCGALDNSATVAATNEAVNGTAPNTDTGKITVQCADVEIEKTAVDGTVSPGEDIIFAITVTNLSATATATNVDISDDLPNGVDWRDTRTQCTIAPENGTTGQVLSCNDLTLAPGASFTVNVIADWNTSSCGVVTNTATVAADGDTNSANNSSTATVFVECPSFTVTKACPTVPAGLRVGQFITYDVTIANTGNVPLTEITVTESRSDAVFSPDLPTTLAVGDSYTGTVTTEVTQADADTGSIDNTITVDTEQTIAQSSTAECPFTPVSSIDIEKSCPTIPDGARVGDSISYLVTITNTGDITLTGVNVFDNRAGSLDQDFPTTFAPGQTVSRTFTSQITLADAAAGNVNNTATVTTTQGVTDSDTATCPFNPVEGVDITKSCPTIPADARVGAAIAYTVTITNTGDVTLTNVAVTDTRTGSFDADFPTELAPGDSVSQIFTSQITFADALNGNVNNTATVNADALLVPVTDTAVATCPFDPVESIDITKSCPIVPEGARIGDAISYTVTVTNTGDVPVSNVVVTETRAGSLDAAFSSTFTPGQTETRIFTSQITALDAVNGNVNNTASVTGDANGVAVSDSAQALCPFNPVEGIEITKSCPVIEPDARVGDPISYTVTIRNTGDVPLTEVAVTDTRAGDFNLAFPTTLGVNQSETRTFTSTITAADVTNNNVNNSATVTANALLVPVTDTALAECPFNPIEGIEITKSCPVIPAGARAGDSISYQVTIRNTGDVTLTNVAVTETRTGTLDSDFPTTLTAGQVETRTFTSTITLADAAAGNVNNTATVTADAAGQSVSDTALAACPFDPVESIEITKTCPVIPENTRVGTEITYSVTIRNTGDTVISGIVVTESRAGSLSSAFPATLDPGDSATRLFTTAITLADAAAGNVVNTASVTGSALGVAVSDSDTATCPFNPFEGVEITKSCPVIPENARIGATITYTVTIRNSGDTELSGITVTDDRAGDFNEPFPATLAPGVAVSRTFTSTITPQDAINGNVNNTATVSASALGVPVTDSDTATCPFNPVEGVDITKSCPVIPDGTRVGASISYTVTVTNTGDVPLSNVVVTESRAGTLSDPFPATLAVGEVATRIFTSQITAQDALNGNVNNTATVTADALLVPVTDTALATCPFNPVESVEITKSCPVIPEDAVVGDAISYSVTIRNTGDVPLTNVAVTDTRDGNFDSAFPATLPVNESATRIFTSAITAQDALDGNVNNSATVTAMALLVPVTDTALAECPFDPVEGVEITKSCPVIPAGTRAGASISYTVTIENIGDTPLTDVAVTDTRAGDFNEPFPTTLAPGEVVTRTFTSTITLADAAAGNVNNSATVTANALQVPVTDTAVAECPFDPVESVDITKSCPVIPDGARVGASISYSVTVTNTGDITLTGITVTDTRAGSFNEPFPATLAPGAGVTRTFTSTITLTDAANGNVNNTATVTTEQAVSDSATAECSFNPVEGVDITKSCPVIPEGARIGAAIAYTVTITNTGDVTLTNIVVTETRDGTLNEAFPATLAPGGSATRTFTSLITADDALNGNVNNTASVTADALLVPVSDTALADCPFNPVEGIEITKSCPVIPDGARVGAAIAYTVTITNTGDTPLSGIVVTESRDGTLNEPFPATLAVGASASRTFTSTITLADAAAGNVNNTASVTANALQVPVSDTALAECPLNPVEGVEITKSCPVIPAGARVGDAITYSVTVTNTGDTELSGITVTDDRDGDFNEPFPATLNPGQAVTRTFTSTITAQDALNGNVNNTASVTANALQVPVSDSATADCPFNPVEGVDITKSCPVISDGARVGTAISYTVTITNTGDVPLSNIAVTETRTGTLDTAFPTELAPRASATRTFTSAITADDVTNNNVNNTASVTANALQVAVSDSALADCPFNPVEGIEITKSCPVIPAGARAGDEISYTVTITNTGDVPLTGIVVTDSRAGSFNEPFPATLAAGVAVTRTFTSTITLDDAAFGNVNNSASVTASAAGETVGDEAFADCPFDPVESVDITKSCPVIPAGARVGASISYTITITNTGDVNLVNIVVTETRTGTLSAPFPTELAPGASATRTFTGTITLEDAANGNVNNSATVTADAVGEMPTSFRVAQVGVAVTDTALADCPFNPVEGVDITKSCPVIPAGARVGDPIAYNVTITNTGDTTLSNIEVTESRSGTLSSAFPTELAPGASATRVFTSTITLDDAANGNVNNTASVTADALQVPVSDTATAECPFNPVEGVDITKSCPVVAPNTRVGTAISYTVTITNTGDTALSNIVVTDSRDGSFNEAFPATLAPGVSVTRTFTSTITLADAENQNVNNTASVTASALGVAVSDSATAECAFDPFETADITKTCPVIPAGARVGDAITYQVTILNDGDVTLTNIVVTESRAGSFDSPFPTELAPNESATRTFTSTITFADAAAGNVNNTVSMTADAHETPVTYEETAECPLTPVEGIQITKSCPVLTTGQGIGSTITYTVTIANTGDTTLTGIVVTDGRAGSFDTPFPAELDPGDSATRTFTSTITEADAAAGNVNNTVTVTTDDETILGSATAECPLTPSTVVIHKTGNLGELPLEEVCFELRQGETVLGPVCTDAEGVATFTNVPLGTYTLVEESTPAGYIPVEPMDVVVGHAETVTYTIDNPRGTTGILVYKLDCQVDPGEVLASDLFADLNYVPDGCVRVAGVGFSVNVDDEAQDGPFVTGADGSFLLDVQVFTNVVVTEDITTATPGYLPREGTLAIDSVAPEGQEGLVFVNLAQDGDVKIIKMVCKVEKKTPTRFEITDATGVILASAKDKDDDKKCWRGANVAFTITGGSLTQPLKVTTDRNGEIHIGLRAGDYTIVEDSTGASAEFTVVPNETTVIKVTNYTVPEKPGPKPTPVPTPKPQKPETPVVTDLPDTGAGTGSANGSLGWLSVALMVLGGLAGASLLAMGAKRRRSQS